ALGAWGRAAGLTASATEEGLEDVAESAESAAGREALPVLAAAHIVVAALLRVGENIVGQCDGFELVFVTGIDVRVVRACQLPVRRRDRSRGSVLEHS